MRFPAPSISSSLSPPIGFRSFPSFILHAAKNVAQLLMKILLSTVILVTIIFYLLSMTAISIFGTVDALVLGFHFLATSSIFSWFRCRTPCLPFLRIFIGFFAYKNFTFRLFLKLFGISQDSTYYSAIYAIFYSKFTDPEYSSLFYSSSNWLQLNIIFWEIQAWILRNPQLNLHMLSLITCFKYSSLDH